MPVDLWRQYLLNSGVIDAEGPNPRADFKRVKDGLATHGEIAEWNDVMWAARSSE